MNKRRPSSRREMRCLPGVGPRPGRLSVEQAQFVVDSVRGGWAGAWDLHFLLGRQVPQHPVDGRHLQQWRNQRLICWRNSFSSPFTTVSEAQTLYCRWELHVGMAKVLIKRNLWHSYHNDPFKHTKSTSIHPTHSPITIPGQEQGNKSLMFRTNSEVRICKSFLIPTQIDV